MVFNNVYFFTYYLLNCNQVENNIWGAVWKKNGIKFTPVFCSDLTSKIDNIIYIIKIEKIVTMFFNAV